MKQSESIKNLAPALHEALKSIHNVAPNKNGYGYKYADLALIIDKSKPYLLENNLFIIQSVSKSAESVAITTSPFEHKNSAIERPIPLAAPVTRTILLIMLVTTISLNI